MLLQPRLNVKVSQRQVLTLRYYSNMKFVEIAELLGCPLNTALGRMHKAMIKLKELMMERAGDIYVLAHAAKLGQRPFHAWAPLVPGVTLVTDSSATDEQIAPFEHVGISVVTV